MVSLQTALAPLDIPAEYPRLFTDAVFWAPLIRPVFLRHRLLPCTSIRAGVPGTYPTFVVDERWVIKFFGRLFDGGLAFETERQVAGLLAEQTGFPAPVLVAQGCLLEDRQGWPWPYLIFRFVPGISLGEVYQQVSSNDRLYLARELGQWVRQLHDLSLPVAAPEPQDKSGNQARTPAQLPANRVAVEQRTTFRLSSSWQPYQDFINRQAGECRANHQRWGRLPAHLIEQIDEFVAVRSNGYIPQGTPHLIHADLTRDHLLGRLEQGRWRSLALIDFGDAMTGDLYYELAALQMDLFAADRRLLAAFMDAYGWEGLDRAVFARRSLAMALLHQFDVFAGLSPDFLQRSGINSLDQLAERLFGIDD